MLFAASDTFKTLFVQVYPGTFKHIEHYQGIFTRIEELLRNVQAYSDIFNTLCNPRRFTALLYSEPWHI